MRTLAELMGVFLGGEEARRACRVVDLYREWEGVVGEELAGHVKPLGHRGGELRLGVADVVVMQEMVFFVPELLERVNGWLGQNLFDKVQFDLIGSKVPLDATRVSRPIFHVPAMVRPAKLGGLVGKLDPTSPVGRCYEKYVRFFSGTAKRGGRRKTSRNTDLEAKRT
ncbi:DUF721 domain-containing protein [Desulfolutivibrio sulfoxidireducens]|nr:DUF721 domain-containing protein [Desulfolutivibrio sulfoxidireducens]QLA17878.1 DUF721 domain-containing protein [Desulfolutivibrio sulfoxidireducens]QLA21458.1 DUF721 domain-containing protein [Desulfolutivibrio sulfoxidireducens]